MLGGDMRGLSELKAGFRQVYKGLKKDDKVGSDRASRLSDGLKL
jgi:hypothetical protein